MSSWRSQSMASLLVAVAVICGTWGLHRLIALDGLVTPVVVMVLGAGAATAAVRALTRSRIWPTVGGLVGAALVAVPSFSINDAGERALIPTPEALSGLRTVVTTGLESLAAGTTPVTVTHDIAAVVGIGAALLFVLADALAVSGRIAAIAGLVLIVPWLPAVVFQYSVSLPPLLIAIGAWIALLSWARPHLPGEQPARPTAIVASATLAVVATALIAPTAIGGAGWGTLPQLGHSDTTDLVTRLNLDLDLRRSLTERSQSVAFSYATLDGPPDVWKLYTLSDFDGSGWDREEDSVTTRSAETGVLWPTEVPDWTDLERQRIDVHITSLAERSLPVPGQPRTVNVGGEWFYDPIRDEVSSPSSTTEGLRYIVVSAPDYHQASALRRSEDLNAVAGADQLDPRYRALDPSIDVERISALTAEVIGGASTRYDQMVAIQTFLRSPSQFSYSITVSTGDGDAVSQFLDDRVGYCVQFATTMVVMARTLDIPARIAVGFLSGDAIGNSNYVVTGSDAHAWPEIYFPEHGWVRFEPTPAVQTGLAPAWTDPFPAHIPVPREILENAGQTVPPALPELPELPQAEAPTDGGAAETAAPAWWLGLVALAVATLAALWWWSRRRAATADAIETPETVWATLLARLPAEVRWPDTLTTWEAYEHLQAASAQSDNQWTDQSERSWRSLTQAMERHRYAPGGTAHGLGQLEQWADDVVVAMQPGLPQQAATGRPARADAQSAPRHDA